MQAILKISKHVLKMPCKKNIDLSYAVCRNQKLTFAELDDANLKGADFYGSNLTGANLSEAELNNASFENADLYATCLAYASLNGVNFMGAGFGGTILAGANLSNCTFYGTSCHNLNFTEAQTITNCFYIKPNQSVQTFSGAPLIIKGLKEPVIFSAEKFQSVFTQVNHHLAKAKLKKYSIKIE